MKNNLLLALLLLLGQNAFATGDPIPTDSAKITTYTFSVAYVREWEYSNGARNDGPMLVITSSVAIGSAQGNSFYYDGNPDLLKMYQATLFTAQSLGKPVTILWGTKWAWYKNVLDDADLYIEGWHTGFKILGIDLAP